MKNVLVIGSNGFVGKELTVSLRSLNYKVFEFNSQHGDIGEQNVLDTFDSKEIQHVFHLAARSFVPDSWTSPYDFYKTNVLGTLNVLEFCKKNKANLTTISSYVYGSPEYLPIDEGHPLKAFNPYCQTKIFAESICQFYKTNFNLQVTVIRPFNVYGPNQRPQFLIPEIIHKAFTNREVEVMDLQPKRDFVYVGDLVEAIVLTIDGPPDTYNIGSGVSVSVEEIIKCVLRATKQNKSYRSKNQTRKNEVLDVVANINLAKEKLGWSPKTKLEEGIIKCINSYLEENNAK